MTGISFLPRGSELDVTLPRAPESTPRDAEADDRRGAAAAKFRARIRVKDVEGRPAFVALFAFFFAVAVGAVWEVFEFGMDRFFGTDMQPATAYDPSGLTDTIDDLIVDTIGAAIVSLAGWRYLTRAREPRVDDWARRFIQRNPQIFRD